MDPFFVLVFTFVLLLVLLVGGFVTFYPVTRRLGALLERRLEEGGRTSSQDEDLVRLGAELRALRSEVRELGEQQRFLESLLGGADEAEQLPGRRDDPGDRADVNRP